MRKQIAAANWKMNLTLTEGEALLDAINAKPIVWHLTKKQYLRFLSLTFQWPKQK